VDGSGASIPEHTIVSTPHACYSLH